MCKITSLLLSSGETMEGWMIGLRFIINSPFVGWRNIDDGQAILKATRLSTFPLIFKHNFPRAQPLSLWKPAEEDPLYLKDHLTITQRNEGLRAHHSPAVTA